MEACDIRGETVSIGSYARYGGTGTVGQVSDIKTENNSTWAKFNENSSLLYSLLVYDANDVQHQCYEDITIYPENYSKSNPICKTIPDGYVILKVKYAGENLTPCDFEITLSK